MKRFIAVVLVSSIISGVFHIDEMIKFPFLIQHYAEHKIQHPADSVLSFLYKHYVSDQKSESEKDKKSDSHLPFKSTQSFHSHFTQFTFCENKTIQVLINCELKLFIFFTKVKIASGFFDIWQPPKVS